MAASIRISDLKILSDGSEAVLSARVDARRLGWRGGRLWFRMPADLAPRRAHGDPFVAGLLLPAMVAGLDVIVDGPLSPSLRCNLERMQELLVSWNPRNEWTRLRRVGLRASSHESAPEAACGTGLFFSGGIDSLYSLATAQAETGHAPDALLFVKGFDIPLAAKERAALVVSHVSSVARLSGRRLIVMETNFRDFVDPVLTWQMAHGGGLAAAGHALGGYFARWLISGADSHHERLVSGTTFELDPLWSRSGLSFVSVGTNLDRQGKAEALAGDPHAHRHLVVCWKARGSVANCGRCAKCIRTMLQFLVLDTLDRFETLPHDVSPDLISERAILVDTHRIAIWERLYQRLSERPEWRPLAQRVQGIIERTHRFERTPGLSHLATRERRLLALEWSRQYLRRNLPVPIRRRVVPLYRYVRNSTAGSWRHQAS